MIITKKQLIEQLTKLISFRSISGNATENARLLDYVESIASDQAVKKRFKNGNAEILLLSNNAEKLINPDFGYLVHTDVVAADDDMWTMKVEGKIAKGRGVTDMKYSIPIGVAILNNLLKKPNSSNISFTMALTTDEETGGTEGADYLAEKLKFNPEILFVPDGGADFKLIYKSKGLQQLKLTKIGKSAHASTPWKGENAIVPLCKVVNKLMEKYEKTNKTETWDTTLNIGKIQGGISINQVCPEASVELDFRYPETQKGENIIKEVRDIIKNIDKSIKIETVFACSAAFTDTSHPGIQKFIEVMAKHIGRKITIEGGFGGSDASQFSSQGVPIIMMRPKGEGIHEKSEWLDLDSAIQYAEGVWKYIDSFN